jgi:hypothetical protein
LADIILKGYWFVGSLSKFRAKIFRGAKKFFPPLTASQKNSLEKNFLAAKKNFSAPQNLSPKFSLKNFSRNLPAPSFFFGEMTYNPK